MLLLGCAEPTDTAPDSVPAADTGVPALPEWNTSTPAASWSPEDATRALTDTLAGDFPSPWVARERLDAWLSHGDEGCPGEGTWMISSSLEGCTAASGWVYVGVGGYELEETETQSGISFFLDAVLSSPEGAVFEVGGHWGMMVIEEEGATTWDGYFNGTWRERESDWTWLQTGASGWFTYYGANEDDGDRRAWIDGSYATGGNYLLFEDVGLGLDGCEGVPSGAFGVLDPSGGWWKLDFGDCVPCGSLSFEGEAVESECVELGGFLDKVSGGVIP